MFANDVDSEWVEFSQLGFEEELPDTLFPMNGLGVRPGLNVMHDSFLRRTFPFKKSKLQLRQKYRTQTREVEGLVDIV